jgi:tetratricopeptide (TPR) repeat protein
MIGAELSNRYRIDSELGRGGMGVIYRAHDLLLGRDVAVKLLVKSEGKAGLGTTGRERLLREARSAAQLNHPHIVTIYDVIVTPDSGPSNNEQDGNAFIVMELVEGASLHARPPSNLEETLAVARQVCSALEHAHAHGIVHRDLKPENVLWAGPVVKLGDFGLARSLATRLSIEGEVAGSVFYLAPEQALGQEVDGRADLYALGVMLYELSAGRLPFTADDPVAVISQHMRAPVVPPSTYNPNIPPRLEALILRLLAKRPEDRPASAKETRLALEEIQEEGVQAGSGRRTVDVGAPGGEAAEADKILREHPLQQIARGRMVGRSAESQALRQHWSSASQGQAQFVLLSGEPGVGKTRLADEFIAYARLQGAAVLKGGCYEYEASIPYLPLAEALREWASAQPESRLRERLGGLAAELARLAPEIENRLGSLAPNPPLPPDEERLRLFDHFARFLQGLSAENGLLLFVDDLHWADRGTLSLLHYLLRRLRGERVLLLAVYREIELDRAHPLAAALVEWNRERGVALTRIQLGRLSLKDCQALLGVLFGQQEVSEEFVQAIFHETEGNPFFIEEVIKALIEAGQIYRQEGAWQRREVEELAIPQSIKEAVGRRLNRLSPQAGETLQQAAVLGKVFEFGELAAFAGVPEDRLLDALDEALAAQLIQPEGEEAFVFTHDKIREVLYEELNPIRRRRLHQRLAESLERLYPGPAVEPHVQDLANHFLQSGDLQKGLYYAILAAEKAVLLYAYEEALRYYGLAAECAHALELPARLAEVEEAAGDTHAQRGMFYPAAESYGRALEQVAVQLEQAAEAADREQLREASAVLKNKIATVYAQVGDVRGPALLREAQKDLNPQTQLLELANNLAMQGRYLHYRGQHSQAIAFLQSALELAEPADLPEALVFIYSYLSGAYQHLGLIDQSMEWAQACVALGERENNPFATAVGYEFLAEDLYFLARWEEGIECALKDQEIGEQIGSLDRVAWSGFAHSVSLFGQGRLAEARRLAETRLALAEQTGDHRLIVWYQGLLSMVLSDLGEQQAAEETGLRAVQGSDRLEQVILQCWSRNGLAYGMIQEEDWEGVLDLCRQQVELYTPLENRVARLYSATVYPLALVGLGRADEAVQFIQDYLATAGDVQADFYLAAVQSALGQALAAQGRSEEALAALDTAVERLEAQGSLLELARALQRRGRLLEKIGEGAAALSGAAKRSGSASQKDLEKAGELFERCGVLNRSAVRKA